MSHFGDLSKCWNELLVQKTYVILLQPFYTGKGHNALFKARYDQPFGAAIDFTMDVERKLLKAMGKLYVPEICCSGQIQDIVYLKYAFKS